MLQIKVYNTNGAYRYLELNANSTLDFEKVWASFDDNLDQDEFSLPITIPMSPSNREWLGFPEHFNTAISSIPDYWRVDVYDTGIPILQDGKLKLLSHQGNWHHTSGTYEFNISASKSIFGTAIRNKKLTDLKLGGAFIWDSALDSRQFAMEVMTGLQPDVYAKMRFVPVAFEDYFDTSAIDEDMRHNIANYTFIKSTFPLGWKFGLEVENTTTLAVPGDIDYLDYRTIPFFRLQYVLQQVFIETGYTVGGDFFNIPDFEKLLIFNNYSIEKYVKTTKLDANREINPINHVPEMLITEFLIAVQNTFNLKFDFAPGNVVEVNFKFNFKLGNPIPNINSQLYVNYDNARRHESYEGGYALAFSWDSADSFASEKMQPIKDINVLATVNTFADISGLTFGVTLDDSHYVFVSAENYYYKYSSYDAQWLPYSEDLHDYEVGAAQVKYQPAISPLCAYYKQNLTTSLYNHAGICGVRQQGSYINNARTLVKNSFALRIFYGDVKTSGAYTDMPFSFAHNYNSDGDKLANYSLSWKAKDGLYNQFWKLWLTTLQDGQYVNAKILLDATQHAELKQKDAIHFQNNYFLIRKSDCTIPTAESLVGLELIKI